MVEKTLIPNVALRKAIDDFRADPSRRQLLEELTYFDTERPAAGPDVGAASASASTPAARVELLIVGPAGVGKSSLLRCLRDGDFLAACDSTLGLDLSQKRFATGTKKCNAKIWDTSGQALFRDTIRTQ